MDYFSESLQGASGLDGTDLLPTPKTRALDSNIAVFMHESIFRHPPQTVWLIATGALTNVGLLFSVFPDTAEHIAGLSIMGGAVGNGFTSADMGRHRDTPPHLEQIGNITPWAEFNILVFEELFLPSHLPY